MRRMCRYLFVVLLSMASGGVLVLQGSGAGAFENASIAALSRWSETVRATVLQGETTGGGEFGWGRLATFFLALLGGSFLAKKVLSLPVRGLRSLLSSSTERRAIVERYGKYIGAVDFKRFLRELESGPLNSNHVLRPLITKCTVLEAEIGACTSAEIGQALPLRHRLDRTLARISRLEGEAVLERMARIREDLEGATDLDEEIFQRVARALRVASGRARREFEKARKHERRASGFGRGPFSSHAQTP